MYLYGVGRKLAITVVREAVRLEVSSKVLLAIKHSSAHTATLPVWGNSIDRWSIFPTNYINIGLILPAKHLPFSL
ncbi:hypothetical protein [Nitrosomonas communis]|uniref:hypothetical protein n=1 Tax=Nitrosomonas communis TaxID=44574 RepID=UPI0011152BCF|nr:hypothetical protein [Nitrosomonas communis]